MQPDASVIARAQRGDADAKTAVLRYYARTLRYLVSRLGAPYDVDDQMQELYAKILTVLPRYEVGGKAALGTWIYAVAQNWLLEQRRKKTPELIAIDGELATTDAPSVEVLANGAELRILLERAVARLPEAQQRVFVLAKLHGQPLEAIAEVENVSLGTVKSRLHRATAEVARRLGHALDGAQAEQKGATRGTR